MSEPRKRMDSALKSRFVPALRERGFVGSLPHLRRALAGRVDYLNVQYLSAGGSFTLNLGRTGPDGFVAGPFKDLPVAEITANHVFRDRRRVTPRDAGSRASGVGADFWEFAPRSYDASHPPQPQEHYDAVADQALDTFLRVGEPWFARPDPPEQGDEQAGPPGGRQPGDPGPLARLRWRMRLSRPPLRVGVVVGGLEPPLWRRENWLKIVPVMSELVERLPRPVSILSYQTRPDRDQKLPFGRMGWNEAGHRKWTSEYLEAPEPAEFILTEFWAPGRSTWAEEGRPPEMYARLDRDPFGEVQGFILALRRDVLAIPGVAEAADRTLAAVAAALPGARQAINDRGWAERKILMVEVEPLDHPAAALVHRYGEKRPWSQVPSFAAR